MEIKDIEWRRGKYGILCGYIDKVRLFSIDTGLSSNKVSLRHSIPGFVSPIEKKTEEEAKEVCKTIIHRFVEKMIKE